MDSYAIRTVFLALVLAVLIAPFGGVYTLPSLLVVAAIAAFDLWRHAQRRERLAAGVGEPSPSRFQSLTSPQRFGVIVAGFVVVIAVILVIQALT